MFDRWATSEKVEKNYDSLKQVILLEEFKNCVHPSIKTHLEEHKAKTLTKAAEMADEFYLSHKHIFNKNNQSYPFKRPFKGGNFKKSPGSSENKGSSQTDAAKSNPTPITSDSSSQDKQTGPFCKYCKSRGHVVTDCPALKRKKEMSNKDSGSRPTALTTTKSKPLTFMPRRDILDIVKDSQSDPVKVGYKPFLSEGTISLIDGSQSRSIKILRDTGASQSLLLADTLSFPEKVSSECVLLEGICGFVTVYLHQVLLQSDLVSGPVSVGVRSTLPVEGVQLLLANDLAGDKVKINPIMTDRPQLSNVIDPIEEEIPDLYPSCAVTRAMAKKKPLIRGLLLWENLILSTIWLTHF